MKYRKERMQDFVREEISMILQQEIKDPGLGFITIIDVRMSDDLKYAKVYYSVYGSDEEKEHTAEALKRATNYIKHLLGGKVRMKYMPEITFVYDTDQERAARIDAILKKVSNVSED
ncbi:MAG TPA: 30S ribosome-binding factor RbfA [Syntrophorhabdales bacterium]|nr:30S ribosome-binding factor RbfA [Syntrophorhabdales bacterium]